MDHFPKEMPHHGWAIPLDATLGIPGLPQSATGQTALFTGINGAHALGRHLNGFPNQKLRDIIAQHSILKKIAAQGFKAAFMNVFRPPFFDYNPYDIIRYLSVSTVTNLSAELPFFNLDDLLQERAIYQDMTNAALREKGFDVPLYSPEKAGAILATQLVHYHFCFYEYFLTDHAGHSQNIVKAQAELLKLELFLTSLLAKVDLAQSLVIVTSDHGNLEDLSVKGHTTNPVMTLLFGVAAKELAQYLKSIVQITPAILALLNTLQILHSREQQK